MMNPVIFAIPGNEAMAQSMVSALNAEFGQAEFHEFPDNETCVRILSNVRDKDVAVICSLHHPNEKMMSLYFFAQTAKFLGARSLCLVAPYLAYMRQDKQFHPGEGITSAYFAAFLSGFVDTLITVDPHLHRYKTLSEIYSIPTHVVHATQSISSWIKSNIDSPVLIGPDSESEQWVREVAGYANAPFLVLKKTRRGDRDVSVSAPHLQHYLQHTPVLVDDIISTARTMIETVHHLKALGMKPSVCVGIHAVFAKNAYTELLASGVARVVTCDTISHPSNAITLTQELIGAIA